MIYDGVIRETDKECAESFQEHTMRIQRRLESLQPSDGLGVQRKT